MSGTYSIVCWLVMVIVELYCQRAVAQSSVSTLQSRANLTARERMLSLQTEQALYSASADSLLYEAYKEMGDHEKALRYLESFHLKIRKIEHQHPTKIRVGLRQVYQAEKNANQRIVWMQSLPVGVVSMLLILMGVFLRFSRRRLGHTYFQTEEKPAPPKLTVDQERMHESAVKHTSAQKSAVEAAAESRRLLYDEMLRLIEDQKLYLNPDLNQKIVVKLLGTNRNYLHQAISQHTDEHFTQIINRYRVNEAKWLLEQRVNAGDESSTEEVYVVAGFNSITSYYRVFKQFTGLTPKEYQLAYVKQQSTASI